MDTIYKKRVDGITIRYNSSESNHYPAKPGHRFLSCTHYKLGTTNVGTIVRRGKLDKKGNEINVKESYFTPLESKRLGLRKLILPIHRNK